MNRSEIKKLLCRKNLTGKEVGKALMAGMIYEIDNRDNNSKLFSQEDFNTLRKKLIKDKDIQEITAYTHLATSFKIVFNALQSNYYQLNYNITSISEILNAIIEFEKMRHDSEKLPLILTEKMYNTAVEEIVSQRTKQDDSHDLLFFSIVKRCITNIKQHKQNQYGIDNEIEALKSELISDSKFISANLPKSYMEYVVFKDGQDSRFMDKTELNIKLKELERVTKAKEGKEKMIKLSYNGVNWVRDEYKKITKQCIDLSDTEVLQLTEQDSNLTLKQKITLYTLLEESSVGEVFIDNNMSDNVTKYDILLKNIEIYTRSTSYNEFVKDFPHLSRIINTTLQLDEQLYNYEDKLNLEELLTSNTLSSNLSFLERQQMIKSGIAILKDNLNFAYPKIEKQKSEYIPKIINNVYSNNEKKLKEIKESYALVLSSISYLYAYQKTMDILEEVFNFHDTIHNILYDKTTKQINSFNNSIYLASYLVYGDLKTRYALHKQLKKVFPIIDIDSIRIKEDMLKKIKAKLNNDPFSYDSMEILQNLDRLIETISSSN